MSLTEKKLTVLLTGGAGFVGKAILRELADPNPVLRPTLIRIFDRQLPSQDSIPSNIPVETVQGDICVRQDLERACVGVDVVIHLASMVDWGTHPAREVHNVNVDGTKNVIAACQKEGVKVLVYTSSLDAIFCGRPIHNADETFPYPYPFTNAYSETKALAEQLVQGANSTTLQTVVLRPSGIYGEGDPYHLTGLFEIAQKGPYFRVGNGTAKCMHIYVGNVAHGHLMAAKALVDGNAKVAGQIYFLVDSKPQNFFHHLDPVLEASGLRLRPKNMWIPKWFIYPIAALNEAVAFLLRPIVKYNPKLARFAITYICTDFTLNGEKAGRDFAFSPKYDNPTAVKRSADWFKKHGPVKSTL